MGQNNGRKAAELEASIREMMKAGHRFLRLHRNDAVSGGICNPLLIKRLTQLEKQFLQRKRKSDLSEEQLRVFGHQLAKIVSEACKSLISYLKNYLGRLNNNDNWSYSQIAANGSGA